MIQTMIAPIRQNTALRLAALTVFLVLFSAPLQAVIGGVAAEAESRSWVLPLIDTAITVDPSCTESGGSDTFCRQICGASLIAPRWAVSAAHCLINRTNLANLALTVGSQDINSPSLTRIAIENFYAPDGIPGPSNIYQDDIILLRLAQEAGFAPISLAGVNDMNELESAPEANDLVEVLGWGRFSANDFPSKLQRVRLELTPDNCGGLFNPTSMLCASENTPGALEIDDSGDLNPQDLEGEDACELDSGGPLLYVASGKAPLLVGIVSWAVDNNCGTSDFGTAYTRMPSYLDWLESTTAAAGSPLVDLATNIDAPSSVATTPTNVSISLSNQSVQRSINNTSLNIRFSGTGMLHSPVSATLNCTAAATADGYDCQPTVLPLAAGTNLAVELTASGLQDNSSLLIQATAVRGDGEEDYHSSNDTVTHTLSQTNQPDLKLTGLGAITEVTDEGNFLWLNYLAENHSSHIDATGSSLTVTLPAGQLLSNSGTLSCSGDNIVTCLLPNIAASDGMEVRLGFLSESTDEGQAEALLSGPNGDFPSSNSSGGNDSAAVTTYHYLSAPEVEETTSPILLSHKKSGGILTTSLLFLMVLLGRNRQAKNRPRGLAPRQHA